MSKVNAEARRRERRIKAINDGWLTVTENVVFSHLGRRAGIGWAKSLEERDGWAVVNSRGSITVNRERDGEPAEWAWVFAHLLLHLGLGHLDDEHLTDAAALRDGEVDPVYARPRAVSRSTGSPKSSGSGGNRSCCRLRRVATNCR